MTVYFVGLCMFWVVRGGVWVVCSIIDKLYDNYL